MKHTNKAAGLLSLALLISQNMPVAAVEETPVEQEEWLIPELEEDTYTIEEAARFETETFVSEIEADTESGPWAVSENRFSSLTEALEFAPAGSVITLAEDASVSAAVVSKAVSIDLGSNTLFVESEGTAGITLSASNITISNGTIRDARAMANGRTLYFTNHANVVLNNVHVLTDAFTDSAYNYALRLENGASLTMNGGSVRQNGGFLSQENGYQENNAYGMVGIAVLANTSLVLNNTQVLANAFGIVGNGNNHGTNVLLNAGTTVESVSSTAIYHPQFGTLSIQGAAVSGCTGIEMRAGSLHVYGGSVSSTYTPMNQEENLSGTTTNGAAIVLAQHTTGLETTVNLLNGTFTGFVPVVQTKSAASAGAPVSLNVFSGIYQAVNGGRNAIEYADADVVSVFGGWFNTLLDADILSGVILLPADHGYAVVSSSLSPAASVLVDGVSVLYDDVQSALESASVGQTVTLLADAVLENNAVVSEGIVVDLNGFALHLEGSSRYGLTFSAGSSVIQNGTIRDLRTDVANATAILVQPGSGRTNETASLTLENVDINITGNEKGYGYGIRVQDGASLSMAHSNLLETAPGAWQTVGIALWGGVSQTSVSLDQSSISTGAFAISGNGTSSNTKLSIRHSEVTSWNAAGIYHPQDGEIVLNGSTVSGTSGIEIRGGSLSVQNSAVLATGAYSYLPNENGTTTQGVGIAAVAHNTCIPISVVVESGEVEGALALLAAGKDTSVLVHGGEFDAWDDDLPLAMAQEASILFTGKNPTIVNKELDDSFLAEGADVLVCDEHGDSIVNVETEDAMHEICEGCGTILNTAPISRPEDEEEGTEEGKEEDEVEKEEESEQKPDLDKDEGEDADAPNVSPSKPAASVSTAFGTYFFQSALASLAGLLVLRRKK